MSKHFRPWKIDETQLLPVSVQDYVPGGHLSRFIVALVRESLDLSEIEASNAGNAGQPPFHPGLMTALLLNAYLSEANLAALEERGVAAYIATGRAKHPGEAGRKIGGPLTQAMRDKLKRAGWRSRYRLRKQIVEPVFGQIKQARGFRQFLLRGLEKLRTEWALICTAHNLTKLGSPGQPERLSLPPQSGLATLSGWTGS